MNKQQKLAISIKKVFRCSDSEALEFALDLIKSEGEPNGRIGSFQEISERKVEAFENRTLSERVRGRAKTRAGIKPLLEPVDDTGIKGRVKILGGIQR